MRPVGERGGGTKALADGFAQVAAETGANVEISFVKHHESGDSRNACASAQRGSSGVAVQVLDHALVREAVASLRARTPVVTS